jgi:hypothetical protein
MAKRQSFHRMMSAPRSPIRRVWVLGRPDFTAAVKPHGGLRHLHVEEAGIVRSRPTKEEEAAEEDPRSWLAL